jgi:hypothetical protein
VGNGNLIYVKLNWPTAKQGRFVSSMTAVSNVLYRAKISSCIMLLKGMDVVELTSIDSWSVYINIALLEDYFNSVSKLRWINIVFSRGTIILGAGVAQ